VLVLSKADPGRTKVVLSEVYRPQELKLAAETWKSGPKNLPHVSLFIPGKKGGPVVDRGVFPPFPSEVMRCLNTHWIRNLEESSRVPMCSLSDVHRAMVRSDQEALKNILGLTVRKASSLLVPLGGAQHAGTETKVKVQAKIDGLTAIALLGILLLKSDRVKEVYMKDVSYGIGRLLSLADRLHALYSEEVRKGVLPSQLIGNALMSTALEQPKMALDLLGRRILPYQAWARTTNGGKAGLARWFLNEIGGVCEGIKAVGIPDRTTEMDRAEMLIGYLAKEEKKQEEVAS